MYVFLSIDIKMFDGGRFEFSLNEFICKVLKDAGMDHCNGIQAPDRVKAPFGVDWNGPAYW